MSGDGAPPVAVVAVPGRRRRSVVMLAGGLVLVAALGYLWVSLGYRLAHGDRGNVGEGAVFDTGNPRSAWHELRAGNRVRIAITVLNPGWLSAELDAIRFDSTDIAIDEQTVTADLDGANARPLQHLSLQPGEQAVIWLMLRVTGTNRYESCSGFLLQSFQVRFHVLGFPRTQPIDLFYPIGFRVPGC